MLWSVLGTVLVGGLADRLVESLVSVLKNVIHCASTHGSAVREHGQCYLPTWNEIEWKNCFFLSVWTNSTYAFTCYSPSTRIVNSDNFVSVHEF